MDRRINRTLLLVLIGILMIIFICVLRFERNVSASEYPFVIESTQYGIENEDVYGKKITITGDNTEIYNPTTYDNNIYKGYIYVKKTLNDTIAMYYLITSQGCVASYQADVDYKPKDKLISWPSSGEYVQEEFIYNHPYSLYLIYRPDTEKYDILNATTGKYYDHQIDDAWENDTYFPIIEAESNGKFGVINVQGEMMHEPIYDEIRIGSNYILGYVKEKGNRILTKDGSRSEEFFYSIDDNSGNLLAVTDSDTYQKGVFSLDTMNLIEPCIHERMLSVEEDVYTFRDTIDDEETGIQFKICVVTKDGTWDINDQFGGSYANGGEIQDGKIAITILGDVNDRGNRDVIFRGYVSVEGDYISEHNSIVEEQGSSTIEMSMTHGYYNGLLLKERSHIAYEDEFNGRLVTPQGDVVVDCISLEDISELGNDLILARNESGGIIYDTVNNEILLTGISYKLQSTTYPQGSALFIRPNDDYSKFGIYNVDTKKMSGYIFENNFDWASEIKEYNYGDKIIWYCGDNDGKPVLINELFKIIEPETTFSTFVIDENLNIIWDYQKEMGSYQYQRYKKVTDNQGNSIAEFPYYYESKGVMSPYVVRNENYKYGMVSNYGDIIVPEEYHYIGKNWHDLSYMEIDNNGKKGVIDINGQYLLYGNYNAESYFGEMDIALQDAVITLRDADDSSVCYIYSFEKFVKEAGDSAPLEIVDSYPSKDSSGIGLQISSDIRITFNRNVDLFNDRPGDSLGSIQIKEYDTDKTVLEYNMVFGSKVGQVVYLDSKMAKNSILLKNAMTVLDRGKKYYVLMDNYCIAEEGDSHNPVWFQGISEKDDFTFRIGNNTQVLSDVTYLAACSLVQNNLDGCEGMTVEEYVNSDYFHNQSIWSGSTMTYRRLFLDTLGGYVISDILEPTVYNAGMITLVNESEGRVVFAFKSIEGTIATEQYFTGGYKNYATIKKRYAGKSIVLTGEKGAGALAAYIGAIDNHTTRTFNAPIVAGLDLAFVNNINLIMQYRGIENVPCKNYSCNLFSGIKNGEYWNVRLADNPNGESGSLNQILVYKDNFSFTAVKSEHKANGMKVKVVMNAEDALKTVQSFLDSLVSGDPIGLTVALISEGTEMVLGSAEGDYWRPSRLSPELIYTGGANASDPDEFFGSGKGNMFNFSGGNAVLYGSSGQDIYFINSTTGDLTINDYTDVNYKLSEINNVYNFINIAKFELEDFEGPELKDFIEAGIIISGINSGTDMVYVNTSEIALDQITETDKYYQLKVEDCTIRIQKRNSPITVVGLNNTSVTLTPNQFGVKSVKKIAENHNINGEKDYSVRGLLLKGENIIYDVYVDGNVVESGQIEKENVVGKYHYSVIQEETGEFCLNVNDDVEKVVITGGVLESVRVGAFSDSTIMYVFDVSDNTKMVEINYSKNAVLYTEEEIEVTCSSQNLVSESKPTLLGLSITPPEQTVYEVGEDLNLTGLKVYKSYSDGTYEEISDYQVQGFDNTVPEQQEIQIIHGENKNTFSVEVYEPGMLIKDLDIPENMSISVGMEELLEITRIPDTIHDSELIISSSDESVVRISGSYLIGETPGVAEITVADKYGRKKKTCKVTVSDIVIGDINADGTINLFDLVMCLNHISQKSILYDDALVAADMNKDGNVNLFDLMKLLNVIS